VIKYSGYDRKMKLTCIFLIFAIASACATFHERHLSPSTTVSDFQARSLDDKGLRKFMEENLHRRISPWPPASWDLNQLTLAALYYHPDLDVARSRGKAAEAAVITAGARPNPVLAFTPEYRSNTETGLSPWTVGLALDIPVETAGKRGYRIARAENLSEAARLDVAAAAWRIRSRLRASLLSLYDATKRKILLQNKLSTQKEIARLLEKRLQYGDTAQGDLMMARIAVDKGDLDIREAERQIAVGRARVAEALGVPMANLKGIVLSFRDYELLPTDFPAREARRQALRGRPDILAALARYEAAQSALRLEIARQYPDFHLGPGYAWDQGDNKWTVGVSLSLPVFNRNQGPIAEAEARRGTAEAEFISIQAGALGEIDRALADYGESAAKLKTADALYRTELELVQSARTMFKAGETDRLSLAAARLELYSASVSRLEALVAAQRALGLLEDAVQQPLTGAGPFPATTEINPHRESRRRK
jgi:cobalt-zinc-cadmium efflux system outer membrane protein